MHVRISTLQLGLLLSFFSFITGKWEWLSFFVSISFFSMSLLALALCWIWLFHLVWLAHSLKSRSHDWHSSEVCCEGRFSKSWLLKLQGFEGMCNRMPHGAYALSHHFLLKTAAFTFFSSIWNPLSVRQRAHKIDLFRFLAHVCGLSFKFSVN